nr:uncharacterized protein LOC108015917 isoform X7 [Drosophila suzukii]
MRQCKVAFRNLIHRCKSITTRPLCCGVELLGKQQLILPLYTCTTSSPRNYSKFSTHITTERAMNLLCNLDEEERSNLRSALDKIDADKEKKLYEKLPIKYIENRTSISYSSQRKEWNINGKITQKKVHQKQGTKFSRLTENITPESVDVFHYGFCYGFV